MKKIIPLIIRLILALILIYFIHLETGIATSIFAFTIYVYTEFNNKSIIRIFNSIESILDIVKVLINK